VVGGVQFVFGLIALSLFPHPVWFWVATLVTIVPAALGGANVARWNARRRKNLSKGKPRR
jgi:hypothetical protein